MPPVVVAASVIAAGTVGAAAISSNASRRAASSAERRRDMASQQAQQEAAGNRPSLYRGPEGFETYDPATNTITFNESDSVKQAREAREARRQEVLDSLATADPDRVAQLEELKGTFFQELVNLTVDPALRADIQSGRAGTPAIEREARLKTEAGKQAIFAKESLQQQDVQSKIAELQALESGLSAEAGRAIASRQLAQRGFLERAALEEARFRTLIGSQLESQRIDVARRGQNFQLAGDISQSVSSAAVLKAISGKCLHADSLILTEFGTIPISLIRVGDKVMTMHNGKITMRPVSERSEVIMSQYPMPVFIVEFSDGACLISSANHNIAYGRPITSLWPGDMVNRKKIKSIRPSAAEVCKLYDIKPDSSSGFYIANGIWVESMLIPKEAVHG